MTTKDNEYRILAMSPQHAMRERQRIAKTENHVTDEGKPEQTQTQQPSRSLPPDSLPFTESNDGSGQREQ